MQRSLETESDPAAPAVRWSHPTEEQLLRFLRGELPRAEVKPIVRHMLAGCPECLKVTRPFGELMERNPEHLGGRW